MGREARRNRSAVTAAVHGYKKQTRETVAQVQRKRRSQMRSHLAGMVATNIMQRMAIEAATADEQIVSERLARQMGPGDRVLVIADR